MPLPVISRRDPPAPDGPRSAVLYSRVSSKEQEQGYSIPAQQELLREYGRQQDFDIEQEYADVETAKQTGRPGFAAMVRYLEKHPNCRIVLVEKTDRLYRNLADAARIADLGVELHLVKENKVLSRRSLAAEKYSHGLDVLNAKRYVDNLSEEVKKGMRTKARQGLWPSYAPLGYINSLGPDGKRIIVPDPRLGALVTQLYEWFATGDYSLQRLAQHAYAEGFRFRRSQRRIPVATLHKVLRNPIYMGEFEYGGERYEGLHQPLVTPGQWERVQRILDGRQRKKHRKVTHDFPYSGMVRCGHCGCSLVGEVKKGRYVYYHCTGYRGHCGEPYTREEKLSVEFARHLGQLMFPAEVLEWLEAELMEAEQATAAQRGVGLQRRRAEVDRLQRHLEVMYEDRLDGRIDTDTYDRRSAEVRQQQKQIREQVRATEAVSAEAEPPPGWLLEMMNQLAESFLQSAPTAQRRLLHLLVEDASWKAGELHVRFREPFEQLRQTKSGSAALSNPEDTPEPIELKPAA